jgi:hypothetical protein
MTESLAIALIAAGGPLIVCLAALLLNWRGFRSLNRRMDKLVPKRGAR